MSIHTLFLFLLLSFSISISICRSTGRSNGYSADQIMSKAANRFGDSNAFCRLYSFPSSCEFLFLYLVPSLIFLPSFIHSFHLLSVDDVRRTNRSLWLSAELPGRVLKVYSSLTYSDHRSTENSLNLPLRGHC